MIMGTILLMACDTEKLLFDGPYFVRFTETALTQKESHMAPIKIEVHNAGPAPKSDITINYTIGGTAREGIDYVINGTRGKLRIKSGEYFGYIEVQLINNSNNILRSQDLVLNLQYLANDGSKVYIGEGVSQIGRTYTLTIQDDCILGGDYYGLRSSGDVPTEDITITSGDCETYTLSNWDVNVFTFPDVRPLTFLDNGDNTLTIARQEDATIGQDIEGFGFFNPATRKITFAVTLVELEGKPQFTFTLTPN